MNVTNLKELKPQTDEETIKLLRAALDEAERGELRDVMIIGKGKAGSVTSFMAEVDWPEAVAYMERLKYRLMKEQDEEACLTTLPD